MKAGGPYLMQINDIKLNDILIGDVWLCSGQSNMELPVSRVTDMFAAEINEYSNERIRQIIVPKVYNFHAPQKTLSATTDDARKRNELLRPRLLLCQRDV